MKSTLKLLGIFCSTVLIQCNSTPTKNESLSTNQRCSCDTTHVKKLINDPNFNRLDSYDDESFPADSLYSLTAKENRELWYRDIQNPDTTKFTKLWNDYVPTNYHADHQDFQDYFENRENIDLAFQFGPNMDLWAYHIFVFRKLDCCYLATRSYFRHARFTYKAYSIVDGRKMDSLFHVISSLDPSIYDSTKSWNYSGYFMDNRMERKFFVDFEERMDTTTMSPTEDVMSLYDFVDESINWTLTYN